MLKRIDTWLPISFGTSHMIGEAGKVMQFVTDTYDYVLFEGIYRIGCAYCVVFNVPEKRVAEYVKALTEKFPDIKTEESRGFKPEV